MSHSPVVKQSYTAIHMQRQLIQAINNLDIHYPDNGLYFVSYAAYARLSVLFCLFNVL